MELVRRMEELWAFCQGPTVKVLIAVEKPFGKVKTGWALVWLRGVTQHRESEIGEPGLDRLDLVCRIQFFHPGKQFFQPFGGWHRLSLWPVEEADVMRQRTSPVACYSSGVQDVK